MLPRSNMGNFGVQVDAGSARSGKGPSAGEKPGEEPLQDRQLGAAVQGWQSRMTDAARLRAQVFDATGGRKGLIGGVCVALVAIVGFVVFARGGSRAAAAKRAARRKREEAAL